MCKKVMAAALAAVMTVSLAACGGEKEQGGDKQPAEGDFVYVPEYITLSDGSDMYISDLALVNGRLYYSSISYGDTGRTAKFQYLDMNTLDAKPVVILEQSSMDNVEEEYSSSTMKIIPCEDGSIVELIQKAPLIDWETATEADYRRQNEETTFSMVKLAEDGTEVFSIDITQYLRTGSDTVWISDAFSGKDGNIYVSNRDTSVWIFDKDGNFLTDVKLESLTGGNGYISTTGLLEDGSLAVIVDGYGAQGMSLNVFDQTAKQFTSPYGNLPPECYNTGIASGPNGSVLLNSSSALYEYDMDTQTYTETLKWLNCDLNGDYVRTVMLAENGDIVVYYEDWGSNETSLIILKKTAASEVVQKETITLGCMTLNQSLQSAIVKFNKSNDRYRIEVKEYTANIDWSGENSQNAYQDARKQFNNDILTGNAPDLFVADDVNLKLFAAKGIIEDLNPYLEKSASVNRSDLFESILNVYTVDGRLCTIPSCFYINTLMGRSSEVGEESGWTLDEMIAYADQYPDASIFTYASRDAVLQYCLLFDFDSYVDWESGTCSFDSPEFKKILEFAGRYGEQPEYSISEPKALAGHEALLSLESIAQPQDLQVVELKFGEPVTAIGFPTKEGNGIVASGSDGLCISSTSQNKEAAWSFIEYTLSEEVQNNNSMRWGFPIRKSAYDAILKEAMIADYQLDENGEVMLDENGEPIEVSHYSYGYDDVTFEIYAVTEEEAESLENIIDSVDHAFSYDDSLLNIIGEETAPYFAGQKSVDEVADIIQNRVQVYVNESR